MTVAEVAILGIDIILKVAKAVLDAKQGTITPEEALRRITEASQQDKAVDAKVDAALDAKFPTE